MSLIEEEVILEVIEIEEEPDAIPEIKLFCESYIEKKELSHIYI